MFFKMDAHLKLFKCHSKCWWYVFVSWDSISSIVFLVLDTITTLNHYLEHCIYL